MDTRNTLATKHSCKLVLSRGRRCRYSQKWFEVAPARWHSGWITQVNIEGALVPRVYQDSDPYAPTLWSLIHQCESCTWDGKTIQVYWGLQDFLFFLTKLFYKHFFFIFVQFSKRHAAHTVGTMVGDPPRSTRLTRHGTSSFFCTLSQWSAQWSMQASPTPANHLIRF